MRKREEIPEHELKDILCRFYVEIRKQNGCYIINRLQDYMLVQFGNNWIHKIPRTDKLDSAYGLIQFGSPQNFLHPIISKLDSM